MYEYVLTVLCYSIEYRQRILESGLHIQHDQQKKAELYMLQTLYFNERLK